MMKVPDGWEVKPFSSLASINMGQSPESEFVNENQEGMAFLQGNAEFGDVNPQELYWVTVPKKIAKKDDILISVRAPVGDMNIADKEYCIGRGLSALTINKIDKKFGFYALFQERVQLDRLAQGSTFLAIGKNDFDKLLIKYPKEKKEQERIAKILSTLDKAIESTNRLIEKEKHIKTALMQELLTNGIDQNGQIRTKVTHTYKPTELGLIPEEWEVMTLNKISSKISDGIHTTPIYSESSNFYFINGNNLENGKIIITDKTNCVDEEEYNKHKIDLTDKTILLSINGTIGNLAFYKNEKVVLGKSAAYIIFKDNIDMHFLSFLLSSNAVLQSFELNLTGSTIQNLNLSIKAIKETRIIYPSMEEQKQIAKILTTQDKKIQTEETNLAKLKELKKGLMNDLLSGKVRVKV
jgi:type I restriction enzyme S subunit